MSTAKALALIAVVVCLLGGAAARATEIVTHPYDGITCIYRTETSPRAEHIHIVEIDLTDPGIRFEVTPAGGTNDTVRQRTTDFLNQQKAQVAINCSFFTPVLDSQPNVQVVGLTASLGTVYSPFEPQPVAASGGYPDQSYAILPYAPALNIDSTNHAGIVHLNTAFSDNKHVQEAVTLYNAVSGSAEIVTNGVKTIPTYSGTASGGLNALSGYSDSDSWYNRINARTSIGLTQDNQTLVLFTVDNAGGSSGMKIGEVADMLINDYHVYNALNLDGGGSTSLAMEDTATHVGSLINASSDNALGRAVGSSLVIFATPEPATMSLLAAGTMLLLARRRRRNHSFAGVNQPAHKENRRHVMSGIQQSRNLWAVVAIVSACVLGFGAAGPASADIIVNTPYHQDYSSGAGDFLTAYAGGSSSVVWAVSNGAYTETTTRVSGASFYTWNSVNVGNLGGTAAAAGTTFSISSLMENMSIGDTSVNATTGLRFLADTTNSNTNAYVVDLNIGANPGRVRLVRWNGGTAKVYPDSTQANQPVVANFTLGDPYLVQVFGTYDASNVLDIAVQITDENYPTDLVNHGLPLTHISHTAVNGEYGSTPPTGHYFGYYDSSSSGANTTISVTYDNLSVVPEPATMALLALGGLALIRRRRA